jgi:excinuclease ABC subunit C
MTLEEFKKQAKKIPDAPGVYFFLAKNKEVLYIGKATSLKSRVRSYFAPDLSATRGPILVNMLSKAASIDWRQTDSVLEALILEANLIRTHKPKHNTDLKDDKSFNYVVITKEDFPRILLVRGKELEALRGSNLSSVRDFSAEKSLSPRADALRSHSQSSSTTFVPLYAFGPFPHGLQLKEALRIVRKIFPYRDTCTPCDMEKLHLDKQSCKPCFNRSLGLCPGVCSGEISKAEYAKIIRRISLFFQGKKKELLQNIEKEMRLLAKKEKFEAAAVLRGQVFALKHIQDVSLIKDEYRKPNLGRVQTRIEAYDAAHLGGSAAVGVMVVVDAGAPQKAAYRKFILRSTKAGDDAGALREILSRRLGHSEWPLPRLIVVDGSKAQMNAAAAVLGELGVGIPIVGVVKDDKHRPRGIVGEQGAAAGREKEILLANAEAHRYAIAFHRRRRSILSGLV